MTARALNGLRVVDCSRLIAGGVLATVLADHGADVIKVEHPRSGDPLRTWLRERGELWWKVYARGKRSVTLNLAAPRGQALLRALLRSADVLIENFVPGTFERWGLGWNVLAAENPRLIFARISGWGQDGPYRDRPGFGTMVEAMSGFAATTGPADGPPTLPSFPMADMIAALAGTNDARVKHNELVDAALDEAIGRRTLDEMQHLFETINLTASPVYDSADIAKDPHVLARGILVDVPDGPLGSVRMVAPTPRLGHTPAAVGWPGPPLGAHNREVFAEVGVEEDELQMLHRDGIV